MDELHWRDQWSADDLKQLVHKREVEGKSYPEIAVEMSRNMGSVGRRYRELVAARPQIEEPKPRSGRRPALLHEELGIETYTHMQAILFSPHDGRFGKGIKSQPMNSHWYRYPITLAKIG
ncbi:hypothetical protein [Bradyrhizobium sp. 930_D9_N1_4]|uniref:hypothetical protein n=1 Tax=Bradyrhizobium sp. 930_D9_N1_4 TaxID=3240374 RepID=UPI003F8A0A8C